MDSFQKLLDFLDRLDRQSIYFNLARHRSEAIMVRVDVPGERWEIEFFADGEVQVEVFSSTRAGLEGEEAIDRLFEQYGEVPDDEAPESF